MTKKIEAGKTYPLRGGLTARITVTDIKGADYPIGGYVDHGHCEMYQAWYPDGHTYDEGRESSFDIIILPERKSRWINLYCSSGYSSREQANTKADQDRTHVLEIILEDGKPVDVKIHEVER